MLKEKHGRRSHANVWPPRFPLGRTPGWHLRSTTPLAAQSLNVDVCQGKHHDGSQLEGRASVDPWGTVVTGFGSLQSTFLEILNGAE